MKIVTKSEEIIVFFTKFYHVTNLMALFLSDLGSRNKTACSKFKNSEFRRPLLEYEGSIHKSRWWTMCHLKPRLEIS
jgi:hypothetical protein